MTMRRRALKVAKWTMAAPTLLSGVVWIASVRWFALLPLGDSPSKLYVGFGNGQIGVSWSEYMDDYLVGSRPVQFYRFRGVWLPRAGDWGEDTIAFPAWWAVALSLVATVGLFFIDRRRRIPPGHCRKCGYDLRGAVSDRCSECGTLIAAEAARDAGRHTITERNVSTKST